MDQGDPIFRYGKCFSRLAIGDGLTAPSKNFALFSCFVNGQPAPAIVAVNPNGDEYNITPLFVAVTDDMILTDHDGQQPGAP